MKPQGNSTMKGKSVLHSCALCPYSTSLLWSYKRHMNCHSDEKPFKCPECPYRAKWKCSVKYHLETVHLAKSPTSRPFPCPKSGCNYTTKQKSNLVHHSKIHSDVKSFFCSYPTCNYSTRHKQNLVVHTRIHTGKKPFVCHFESCNYATADKGHLVTHSRTHTKEKPFKCPERNCEYSTAQRSNLKLHHLTHEPKEGEERLSFQCPLCEYSGKTNKHLSAHIQRHTLEKWAKCDEPNCKFGAKTKQEIEKHKLTHSDETSFVCSFESCDFRCNQKGNLSRHLKTHSEERQYKCELCPFRGKTRETVVNHLKNFHSKLRPFKCTESKCNYAAKRKAELKRHLLVHSNKKKVKSGS